MNKQKKNTRIKSKMNDRDVKAHFCPQSNDLFKETKQNKQQNDR